MQGPTPDEAEVTGSSIARSLAATLWRLRDPKLRERLPRKPRLSSEAAIPKAQASTVELFADDHVRLTESYTRSDGRTGENILESVEVAVIEPTT